MRAGNQVLVVIVVIAAGRARVSQLRLVLALAGPQERQRHPELLD
jgi:hypothetical protein